MRDWSDALRQLLAFHRGDKLAIVAHTVERIGQHGPQQLSSPKAPVRHAGTFAPFTLPTSPRATGAWPGAVGLAPAPAAAAAALGAPGSRLSVRVPLSALDHDPLSKW
jgi:hypothetical protein